MSIFKYTKQRSYVGNRLKEIRIPSSTLNLEQFYVDAAALGATVNSVLFEAQLADLPTVVKEEATYILVPGVYKNGVIYGLNPDTGTVEEFSFSRSSSATYIDADGIMQTAPADMPRIDYDPFTGECKGYLLENASTNLLMWSNDFTHWAPVGTTVTPNSGFTSYGKPFTLIERSSDTGTSYARSETLTSLANTTYSSRITLRGATSSSMTIGLGGFEDVPGTGIWSTPENASCRIISGPGALGTGAGALFGIAGLSSEMDTVIEITRKYINAGISVRLFLYPNNNGGGAAGLGNLFSCAQIEALAQCTSYIETTGAAAARTADTLASLVDIVPYPEASVFMNINPDIKDGISVLLVTKTDKQYFLYHPTVGAACSDRVTACLSGVRINHIISKVLSSYSNVSNLQKISVNGSSIGTAVYKGFTDTSILTFPTESGGFISQYIKCVAIIPRQLTDAEHVTATT